MRGRPSGVLLAGVALAELALATVVVWLTLESARDEPRLIGATLGPFIALSFLGVGLYAWRRRPEQPVGLLMIAISVTWSLSGLSIADDDLLATLGAYLSPLAVVLVLQLLVVFPDRPIEPAARRLLALGYATVLGLRLPYFLLEADFYDGQCASGCPQSAFLVSEQPGIAEAFLLASLIAGLVAVGGIALLLRRRERAEPQAVRYAVGPVQTAGAVLIGGLIGDFGLQLVELETLSALSGLVALLGLAALPWAFVVGLARSHRTNAAAVARLVQDLGATPDGGVRDRVAQALGDPTVQLAYWRDPPGGFVTREGTPVQLGHVPAGRCVTLVEHDGRRIGALVHDAALEDQEGLVRAVAGAAGLAMANEALDAALRARVDELEQSRARLLEVSLFERRRIERNLHDGAQQRLVGLALQLSLAREQLDRDPARAAEQLDAAREQLAQGLEELRELARGIHPAILTDRGLEPALRSLAERAPTEVALTGVPDERLPEPVEAAVYFVVAEALTNVERYAGADHATVQVQRENGHALVEVRDDGVGGADPAAGTGLRGLADRLQALDGRLDVESPPGSGTTVRARIPCASS
jgi:signal transduction histidine kinase